MSPTSSDAERPLPPVVAFAGSRCVGSGDLLGASLAARRFLDREPDSTILFFNGSTSERIEVDLRGTAEEVRKRIEATVAHGPANEEPHSETSGPKPGRGRPRLGVVAREVTLLPRHWEWLNTQPGGASVALRRLVEEARRTGQAKDRVRRSQEAAYRFMTAIAGDWPGYEEALRALFAGNRTRFDELIDSWPQDVRNHARRLAHEAFAFSS